MSELGHDSRSSRLRVAYVWRDEVMADVVARKPRKITLGTRGRATFVVPDLGLPNRFPVLKPGSRGYLLTLGKEMTGRLSLAGEETDVAEFLRRGGGEQASRKQDTFRATNVAPGDWGVVHLHRPVRLARVTKQSAPPWCRLCASSRWPRTPEGRAAKGTSVLACSHTTQAAVAAEPTSSSAAPACCSAALLTAYRQARSANEIFSS